MTPLRQRMTEDMQLAWYSSKTQQAYVGAVRQLFAYFNCNPAQLTEEQLRQYFLYLANERKVSRPTATIALCGIKFFFERTLKREWTTLGLVRPRREKKLPVVLSREEVRRILEQVHTPVYRACLKTIYSCGLRLREGSQLQVADIDSGRMFLHVHGKGGKDRLWAAAHNLSFWPFPSRTTISFLANSKSFTRSVKHSSNRRPAP